MIRTESFMDDPSRQTLLEFALDAAWQAGRITLGYFQASPGVERKADNSPVTIADREAEKKLRALIERYWPEHGIIGEELGSSGERADYTWILDPIDGTKSFICGVPFYSTLVALMKGDEVCLGVIHLPALNETVYATCGDGCYWNGRRVHVSSKSTIGDAVLLCSDIDTFARYGKTDAWQRLVHATYFQRTWGDAYGYSLIATGRADVMLDPVMCLWDIAPLQVILEEAGGTLTDWQGNRTIHSGEGVATNGALFEQVMKLIKQDG